MVGLKHTPGADVFWVCEHSSFSCVNCGVLQWDFLALLPAEFYHQNIV